MLQLIDGCVTGNAHDGELHPLSQSTVATTPAIRQELHCAAGTQRQCLHHLVHF